MKPQITFKFYEKVTDHQNTIIMKGNNLLTSLWVVLHVNTLMFSGCSILLATHGDLRHKLCTNSNSYTLNFKIIVIKMIEQLSFQSLKGTRHKATFTQTSLTNPNNEKSDRK